MAGAKLDYRKTPAEQRVTVWLGPEGSIADFDAPTAAEINAMKMVSPSISWNDFDFGLQASETTNDPSLADLANYEDFGASNYGGSMSFYYPKEYTDTSNPHALVYEMTKTPWTKLEAVIRIDGDVKTSVAAADGDLVSVYSVMTDAEANAITGADAYRRTVGLLQQDQFAYRVPVGPQTVTVTAPKAPAVGEPVKLVVKIGGRVMNGACSFRSSDNSVATVSTTGVVTKLKAGTATITVKSPAGTTGTYQITA